MPLFPFLAGMCVGGFLSWVIGNREANARFQEWVNSPSEEDEAEKPEEKNESNHD